MDLSFWTRFIAFLLPKSRAFRITVDKPLRQLFEGLAIIPKTIHDHLTDIYLDIWPGTTTKLLRWSQQMGFAQAQSATTIANAWADGGGQSPQSIQERLRAEGFDVYVHEWWEMPLASPPVARDPISLIAAGNEVLVNDMTAASPKYKYQCQPLAWAEAQCQGDNGVTFGETEGLIYLPKQYATPDIADEYVYYWYVGAAAYPDKADVADAVYNDLKKLVYKYKPMQTRAVMLINVVYEIWLDTTGGSPIMQDTQGGAPIYEDIF